mmetsp:Transcript_5246/g.13135  ORF Transcript_5246/g.13135 Transcript_5246/m.13135 type:complete len:84 (-) Transcript_5246:32-283(-)
MKPNPSVRELLLCDKNETKKGKPKISFRNPKVPTLANSKARHELDLYFSLSLCLEPRKSLPLFNNDLPPEQVSQNRQHANDKL